MPPLVELEKLTKRFRTVTAVRDLDLQVEEGQVLGLIGPNGAGKTTTLKLLATLLRPTSGSARIDGHCTKSDREAVRRVIGYMPDVAGLYEEMSVREYLRFFASVYGRIGAEGKAAITDVLALCGLETKADATCGALSRGMSQRLHLARVLLHDPKLLLLDEPASGLDPRARVEFKELVLTLKRMGKTLIISSHILSELGELCDEIAIIEQAELVYHGAVGRAMESLSAEGRVFLVRVRDEPDDGRSLGDLAEMVRGLPYVDAVREGDGAGALLVRFQPAYADTFALNQELVQRGYRVEHFGEEKMRLEDAFLHLTKGTVS